MADWFDIPKNWWLLDGIVRGWTVSGYGAKQWVKVWRRRWQVQEGFTMSQNQGDAFGVLLRGNLAVLDARAVQLRNELANVEAISQATRRLLSVSGGGNQGVPKPVTVEEVNRCRNQPEALRMIGERGGGRIKLSEAVKLIHESNLTSATLPSLRATLHRHLKSSAEWEQEGRGVYRLVEFDGIEKDDSEWLIRIHEPGGVYRFVKLQLGSDGQMVLEDVENDPADRPLGGSQIW